MAFDHVVADLDAGKEALLVSELNLRLPRIPQTTNAPDQGYPPVREIACIDLASGKPCSDWGVSRK